jgi:2-polyprenyl-6-methoxyphenol hydroxylase-like FAD-dependent oxidoreductase
MSAESSVDYDVAIVGARPAGAATALLLARQGLRVLVVDRGRYGTDTLSTHALMRAGVLQLQRFGVLPGIVQHDTPAVRSASFIYGDDEIHVPVKPRDGVDALYAPRRTILDRAIVDVAADAGVHFSYGTAIVDVARASDGRVSGVVVKRDTGETRNIRTGLVIGADGVHSAIAPLVQADVTRRAAASAATVFGYWADVPVDEYRWYFRPGLSAGAFPTNNGLTCVFASVPARRFAEVFRGNPEAGYRRVLTEVAPDLTPVLRGAKPAASLRGWPGLPGYLRRAAGPGWALVGDAAYFKDPSTAHGITDALVEADYLSHAVARGTDEALRDYERDRDRRVATIFEVTDQIASFEEVRGLHKQLAKAMSDEVTILEARIGEGLLV